jgi:hypothetical protein
MAGMTDQTKQKLKELLIFLGNEEVQIEKIR